MVDLQKTLNLIKELRKTGSDSTILWEDVYKVDFNLNETFVPRKRKRLRMQTNMIIKTWKKFHELVNL
jgi:hypothetical protein